MFEVVEVTRNWFTKTVKMRALEDVNENRTDWFYDRTALDQLGSKKKFYEYRKDEIVTVKYPIRDPIGVGDKISFDNIMSVHNLIPSRYDIA